MREGSLILNSDGRLDLLYPDGATYGGLNCGDTIEIFQDDTWEFVRIEMAAGGEYYIPGVYGPGLIPWHLPARNPGARGFP